LKLRWWLIFDQTIQQINALLSQIDEQTLEFARATGLKCKEGCGTCCSFPDIETTVAEVLPLAQYLWDQGKADEVLAAMQADPTQKICHFYKPNPYFPSQGRCSIYAYRPGFCRLFGYSARRDKYDKLQLATCKIIKNNLPEACQNAQQHMDQGLPVPIVSAHLMNISNIDPIHGQKLLPINQAIQTAIELVGFAWEKNQQ